MKYDNIASVEILQRGRAQDPVMATIAGIYSYFQPSWIYMFLVHILQGQSTRQRIYFLGSKIPSLMLSSCTNWFLSPLFYGINATVEEKLTINDIICCCWKMEKTKNKMLKPSHYFPYGPVRMVTWRMCKSNKFQRIRISNTRKFINDRKIIIEI